MDKISKNEFVNLVRSERARLDSVISEISESSLLNASLPGGRTGKDLLAHITWYEKQMIGVLRAKALVGSDWWNLPLDERNALILEENRSRSLRDVMDESGRVFSEMIGLLEALPEAELHDPSLFAEMPPDWLPSVILAGNTYEHYIGHLVELRSLIAESGQ